MNAPSKPIAVAMTLHLSVNDRQALIRAARQKLADQGESKWEQRLAIPEGSIHQALRYLLEPGDLIGAKFHDSTFEDDAPFEEAADETINCQQSFDEGWGLFLSELTGYRLEKDDEQGILKDDSDAWRLVLQRASYGSALHLRCLEFLRANAPDEWDDIIEFRAEGPL